MFELTQEERKVILFLIAITISGLGIAFALKANPRTERLLLPDVRSVRLNINQAGFEDIVATQRISAKLAQRIIDYRTDCGPFTDISQLKDIKGIGEYRYEKIKDLFYVE